MPAADGVGGGKGKPVSMMLSLMWPMFWLCADFTDLFAGQFWSVWPHCCWAEHMQYCLIWEDSMWFGQIQNVQKYNLPNFEYYLKHYSTFDPLINWHILARGLKIWVKTAHAIFSCHKVAAYRWQSPYGLCYALNWGSKDCKHAPGPIMWSGSDVQTRQR